MQGHDRPPSEIDCKVVFAGPAGSGKSTTLRAIHEGLAPDTRGPLLAPAGPDGSTLFFDLLTVELGSLGGRSVRLQLLSGPGDVERSEVLRTVLRGADGVVFVADSSPDRIEANRESLAALRRELTDLGYEGLPPIVFQYNKRDVPGALPVDDLERELNPGGSPAFPTVAVRGEGVMEPLMAVSESVVRALA